MGPWHYGVCYVERGPLHKPQMKQLHFFRVVHNLDVSNGLDFHLSFER